MSNEQARLQAMAVLQDFVPRPTSLITYRSNGQIVVFGDQASLMLCEQLPVQLKLKQVMVEGEDASVQVVGHLGEFVVKVEDKFGNVESIAADAILDLLAQSLLVRQMLPPGYFHIPAKDWDAQQVGEMLEDIAGEFEKPKYFDYNESICAHSVNGKTVCTKCIDACPAEAIQSLAERIEVDPFLCQGGGSCTTVCPSGAITYAYPGIRDQGKRLRKMLQMFQQQGGQDAVVLFHQQDVAVDALLKQHETLLPIAVEELASVGMELCLSAVCYGAKQVVLLADDDIPARSLGAINEQLSWVETLLQGLGMESSTIIQAAADTLELSVSAARPEISAEFDLTDSKRGAMFQAIDYLSAQLNPAAAVIELPADAPFGEVLIDADKCTLCMACVGACPGRALQDGSNREVPEVSFIENSCLQCNGCVLTCPEDAITLKPRMMFDREARNRSRMLNSDTPFACISCGKPFAPSSVINKMQEKLKGHYMFESQRALDRLKMCDDCRVADIVQDPDALGGQFDPDNQFRH